MMAHSLHEGLAKIHSVGHFNPRSGFNRCWLGRPLMSRYEMPSKEALRAREEVVLDHFRDEVRQDWDAVLSTFPHPHYELVATHAVHEGPDAVRAYYAATRRAFPDQRHEIIELRHSADAVIVE